MKRQKKIIGIGIILALILTLMPIGEADEVIVDKQLVDVEPKDGPLTKTFIFCRDITISSDSKGLIDGSIPVLYWRSNGDTEVYIKGLIGGEYENTITDPLTGIFIFFIGDTNEDPFYIHGAALFCLVNY